ncbi:MAG: polysaccharide deacetylase family protein [Porticoccaceae bacterium]
MKEKIYLVAKYAGLFALCRWLTRRKIRVLAYHGIWLGAGHYGNFLYISKKKFVSRMELLKRMGLPVLGLGDALAQQDQGSLPDSTVVLTIDDGWFSTYQDMLGALECYQFPATIYVTSYYMEKQHPVFNVAMAYLVNTADTQVVSLKEIGIENDLEIDLGSPEGRSRLLGQIFEFSEKLSDESERFELLKHVAEILGQDISRIISEKWFHLMTEEEVRDAAERGFDIQLHTHRHRVYRHGHICVGEEIEENRLRLQPLTRGNLTQFCYPSGEYDPSLWPMMSELGVESATTTESGLVDKASHPYALPRILDGEAVSELEFEAELSGFNEVLRQFLSVVR